MNRSNQATVLIDKGGLDTISYSTPFPRLVTPMERKSMDGCTAATYIAYAFSDVATIYPITPVASMGETADKWNVSGLLNLFGKPMEVKEMESELGAAGATHGALAAGALATTFTASQGLMLMIPNMYKISGEMLPGVFHVGCRSLATQALSIFGDHQDVMACRATGFAMLASASVQETHDLAIVAHIAALEGSIPVLHFFDGWRTSNEISTIYVTPYKDLAPLVPHDKVEAFRKRALNPEHPVLRGSAQNWDVYFQNREAPNKYYEEFPGIVQRTMDKVAGVTGRQYHLFDYYGAPDAESIIVAIGSSTEVTGMTVDHLNAQGKKYGLVKVRLYRPFAVDAFLDSIPETVKRIAVLDRTKEPGSQGEPLYLDVAAAVLRSGRDIQVIGGRYGLSSKSFDPTMVKAVFDNLEADSPVRDFTVGITDDVCHRSLPLDTLLSIPEPDTTTALFYGMGSDGTVGASKAGANIICEKANLFSQAYFQYSAKKSGGYTISQLRFGPAPIHQEYDIENAGYIGCNKDIYVSRFPLLHNIAEGGTFMLNTSLSGDSLEKIIPASMKRIMAKRKVKFYTLDAKAIARANNLGVRINMIMLAAFFRLHEIIPYDEALASLEHHITLLYTHEGNQVVDNNIAALRSVAAAIRQVTVPADWAEAEDTSASSEKLPEFILEVARPCMELNGNDLPVSKFTPDGSLPMGTTAYEKRTIADFIPKWDPEKCVQCAECSLVCAHAAIRPWLLDERESDSVPNGFATIQAKGKDISRYRWRIQMSPRDCTGCGSCVTVCPGKALSMQPIGERLPVEEPLWDYAWNNISYKSGAEPRGTVRGSQLYQPLLQFSGACAGCGETPYVKLLTQLMGERLVIANATGCSSIWGANYPSNAYCTNSRGQGPAWANSLFEDNAEYGYGMAVAIAQQREYLAGLVAETVDDATTPVNVKEILQAWLDSRSDGVKSAETSPNVTDILKSNPDVKNCAEILSLSDMLIKKSVWAIGGDGWAYDIGFAGLDHVLARNVDLNILVMDTECYSNTGGQMSKATPIGAVVKYAASGKRTFKKDLGRMMMTYPDLYVASVALGANYQQTIDAITEADAYPGPSIVIAYCPCINHGIRKGMGFSIFEERDAVRAGYWQIYRRDPRNSPELKVDYAQPNGTLVPFINGEDRYADLKIVDAAEAAILQPELEQRCADIYDILTYNAAYVKPKDK